MADVFISYKSEDRAAAKLFADALTDEGVSVWWDPVLRTGETYDEVIERNLREAALVVVLWSPRSVKSKWVRAEATIGERKGGLMPVLIEACDRPIAFELVQTADLAGWAGDRGDARWLDFMGDLRAALSTRAAAVSSHAAPPPPDPLTIETLFWSSIKDGGDAADYESYLQRYPHGQFSELARARLARLAPEPSAAKGALFDAGRYVFVSYPTDIAPALLIAIVRELLGRGLSIWLYDPSAYAFTAEEKARLRWQQAGGSWEQQTLNAIRNASAVVALVNEYSLQSRFQPREFKVAAEKKKLLPFIISDLDYKALPPLFRDMHAPKITADMVSAELGKNRIAMLASDAEALIAKSRARGRVDARVVEGAKTRGNLSRVLLWIFGVMLTVGAIVVASQWFWPSVEVAGQSIQSPEAQALRLAHSVTQDEWETVYTETLADRLMPQAPLEGWILAARTDARAQTLLAEAYLREIGVEGDNYEAARLLKLAASQDFAPALGSLGGLYLSGSGVEENREEAFRLVQMSAERNNANNQCLLGTMYADGLGTAESLNQAIRYWQRAARRGNATCQGNLRNRDQNW